jgi:hypothetical protein
VDGDVGDKIGDEDGQQSADGRDQQRADDRDQQRHGRGAGVSSSACELNVIATARLVKVA